MRCVITVPNENNSTREKREDIGNASSCDVQFNLEADPGKVDPIAIFLSDPESPLPISSTYIPECTVAQWQSGAGIFWPRRSTCCPKIAWAIATKATSYAGVPQLLRSANTENAA